MFGLNKDTPRSW